MMTSNVIKAGVQLNLLDKLTPEMRRTLSANKTMLDGFSRATNQNNMFGPMSQANLAQYERGMARIAASQKLLRTGMMGVGAGVAASLYATNAFVKFEDDLAYIDTLRDGSVSAMEIWGKDIQKIGIDTGKGISDISRGIYQTLSSSIPEEYALDFVRNASKTAVAGRASIETSVNALSTVLNSYDLEVERTMDISDKLFYTVKRGRIEFDQLSSTIAQFASSGSLAQIPFEDLLAALATLTSVGISPDESATSINRFMLSLISLSDQQKELGKSMGIDFNISHMRSIGFLPFLQEISDAVDGDIEQLQKLFPEMRAFRAVAPLIGSANERFKDISEGMQNTAGATETAVGKMTDTMKHKMDIVSQSFESIKISVGEIFAEQYGPGLAQFAGYLGDIAQNETAMENIAGAIKGITGIFAAMGAVGLLGKAVGAIDVGVAGFLFRIRNWKTGSSGWSWRSRGCWFGRCRSSRRRSCRVCGEQKNRLFTI